MLSAFLDPILPIFTIVAVGLFVGQRGIFDITEARAINRFTLFIAVPALIFSIMGRAPVAQFDLPSLGVYLGASLTIYVVCFLAAYLVFKKTALEALLLGMTACFVNHVLYVRPIAEILYGESVRLPVAAVITMDGVIIFGGTLIALEIATLGRVSPLRLAKLMVLHPMLAATFLGIAVNTFAIPVPSGVWTYAEFVGGAAAPATLFGLGIVLSRAPIFNIGAATATIVLANLVLQPLLVWLALTVFRMEASWDDTILLLAAGPCGAMAFSLALQYNVETSSIAKAIVWSTILSVITLALLA